MRKSIHDSRFTIRHCGFLVPLAFFVLQFTLTGLAFGAEEAAHGGEWKEWLWKIVNFAILVFILVKFLNKPLRAFLRQRTELIEKTLKEAQEAKELAAKGLAEVEERLKLKEKEIEEILALARQSAKAEEERLIESGEQMKQKILEQAKSNIEFELKLAKESVKAEAVEIAMELAEKKLKGKLAKEEQVRLIEESLRKMEAKN
ncbi:MAG TPA: ATP synthase F0 subunit B [Thermodesulfovibrionales bacterium]|jgi:F-type H+-transporting ATPase subunit b|nr:ATP synthase F0 subunit B [Thermodesulfovibrionales bacterium]